jgi:hypothetical protein
MQGRAAVDMDCGLCAFNHLGFIQVAGAAGTSAALSRLIRRPDSIQTERTRDDLPDRESGGKTMFRSTRMSLLLAGAALFCLLPSARADHKEYQGRTGLPTVREGKGNVWLERGVVTLNVEGNDLRTVQEFRMKYPGGKLEKGDQICKVAVREDYFRSKDSGTVTASTAEMGGFKEFTVTIDDQPVNTVTEDWILNEKKDTGTRWRTFRIDFLPGDVHTLKIVSVAPLGWDGDRRVVNFVSKDIGGWRAKPDYLEIVVKTPGTKDAKLINLEPKPTSETDGAVRWIYRKADPNRDLYIKLPADYKADRSG